jgi:hypothetical protein
MRSRRPWPQGRARLRHDRQRQDRRRFSSDPAPADGKTPRHHPRPWC